MKQIKGTNNQILEVDHLLPELAAEDDDGNLLHPLCLAKRQRVEQFVQRAVSARKAYRGARKGVGHLRFYKACEQREPVGSVSVGDRGGSRRFGEVEYLTGELKSLIKNTTILKRKRIKFVIYF